MLSLPPVRPRRRPRLPGPPLLLALATVLALLLLGLASCTLEEGRTYLLEDRGPDHQVLHLTPVVSFQLILLRDVHCGGSILCTADWMRDQLALPDPAARDIWDHALADTGQLDTALSVAKATYDPDHGTLKCLLAYRSYVSGWGNTDDPAWCRQPLPGDAMLAALAASGGVAHQHGPVP